MPGIVGLVASISLDVTEALVAAGVGPLPNTPLAGSFAITAATVTTPIVVTIPTLPPLAQAIHVVLSGATGMTEANGTWILTPTSSGADTYTLTTYYDPSQNQYVQDVQNSVGVNPYTGGAVVQTALTDGRIVLGQQHRNENSSPPRIIFSPTSSRFYGSDTNSRKQGGPRGTNPAGQSQTPEQILEQQARMIAGETVHFEVTCWGAANPPDPDVDFDVLQVLYQQVMRTLYYLDEGNYTLGVGRFVDEQESKTQLAKLGHKIVFPLDINTPVLDYILGTTVLRTIDASIGLETPNQSAPEIAWTGTVT